MVLFSFTPIGGFPKLMVWKINGLTCGTFTSNHHKPKELQYNMHLGSTCNFKLGWEINETLRIGVGRGHQKGI